MGYVMMTIEEARKCAKKDAIVLVSVQDLESGDCNIGFVKKRFGECSFMINEAKTVAKICDEFADQLRVFSEQQRDPLNYKPIGKLGTILMSRKTDTP